MKPAIAYIVTGTSRGFGRSLAEEIMQRGQWLYTLSRSSDQGGEKHCNVRCDLRDSRQVALALKAVLERVRTQTHETLVLINNAGVLEPMGPVEQLPGEAMQDHFKVNLLAPVQLTAGFIRGTDHFQGQRRIINISSGAASSPYAGWSLYCAAKAALNSFSACVALENTMRTVPVSICTVAPGILDTDMQRRIRETSVDVFPMRSKFLSLYQEEQLTSPRQAAKRLLDLDSQGRFHNGGQFDLRTFENGQETNPPNGRF